MPPLLKLQGLHREERIFTRIFTEGFHRLGETETEWRQREVPLLLFPSLPRKKTPDLCCSWRQRESWRKHKSLLLFSHIKEKAKQD